jgi:hypothetical protein
MKRHLAAVCLALIAAGCDDKSSSPTSPTTTPAVITTTFTGSLSVGASRFYSFTVGQGGSVSATLASITTAQGGAALETILELGIGFPSGRGCAVTATRNVSPALRAQLVEPIEAFTACASPTSAT